MIFCIPQKYSLAEVITRHFTNLYALGLNPSLMGMLRKSLSSWSKPLEEATKPSRGPLVKLLWFALWTGRTPFSLRTCQLASSNLLSTLVVLLGLIHLPNGNSPSFWWDVGIYLKTGSTGFVRTVVCLTDMSKIVCSFSSFHYCCGLVLPSPPPSRGARVTLEFFTLPFAVDDIKVGIVSFDVGSSSKNLCQRSITRPQ